MTTLLPVIILTVFVALFGVGIVVVSHFAGPKRNWTKAKLMAYESGLPGQEVKDSKIPVKFYLTAILFIIFDIEIIFLYPWALVYNDFLEAGLGTYALGALAIFLGLFVFGLFWEIKSKALEWD